MSIFFENETDEPIGFDYERILAEVVKEALRQEACPYEAEVTITLTDAEGIKDLNRECRGIDKVTDVLSFPMLDYEQPSDFSCVREESMMQFNPDSGELVLGDIVLCVSRAREQAVEYGHTLLRELAFLTAHSMMHLCGYDHVEQGERILMEQRQELVLDKLGITR